MRSARSLGSNAPCWGEKARGPTQLLRLRHAIRHPAPKHSAVPEPDRFHDQLPASFTSSLRKRTKTAYCAINLRTEKLRLSQTRGQADAWMSPQGSSGTSTWGPRFPLLVAQPAKPLPSSWGEAGPHWKACAFAPPHTSLPDAGVQVFRWNFLQSVDRRVSLWNCQEPRVQHHLSIRRTKIGCPSPHRA